MDTTKSFSTGDLVVYPTHGVGKLEKIESQTIAGQELKVLVINFEKKRMTLRLPLLKASDTGLRSVATPGDMQSTLDLLKLKVKSTKGIWARRAQEYETKINSGSLVSLTEVLRELHRNDAQSEQSYSERQIYQNALERLADEFSIVASIQFDEACKKVRSMLENHAA